MTCGQLHLGGCDDEDLGHLGPCTRLEHAPKRGMYDSTLKEWQYTCRCGFVTLGWPMLSLAEIDLGEHFERTRSPE